jgi:hypothetical protein
MDKKTRSNNLGVVIRDPITDAATLTPTDIENLAEEVATIGMMIVEMGSQRQAAQSLVESSLPGLR